MSLEHILRTTIVLLVIMTLQVDLLSRLNTASFLVNGFLLGPKCFARQRHLQQRYIGAPQSVSQSSATMMRLAQSRRFISRSSHMMMSIVDDVTAEMKVAMKAKDTVTLGTIRLIRTSFANAAIELRTEALTDDQALVALRKMAKMRKESIDMYDSNGATNRADIERAELAVIERYLPAAVSDDVVREWAKDAIADMGGAVDNVGKVMGAFMKKHKNDVDGTIAQKIVKEEIEKMKQA